MKNTYKNKLISLTQKRASSEIKSYLENLPFTEKGSVFEWYIAELFKGNGWLVKEQGGRYDMGADLLLYHPKTPLDISLIVQTKNRATPLSFDDTKIELDKFEEKAALKYNCNQFLIVSTNGYVSQAKNLQEFNMLLKEWDYVDNLINKYDPVNTTKPNIELYAHNEVTYNAVKRLWEKEKSVAVVQATGTGKSYIIAKTMTDFWEEGKLVMAPSHYILKQQKTKVPWALKSTTFMTYAKGANLTPQEISQLNCKLIVLDEFHRCGADIWGAGVQKILEAFPEAHILGTSATPIRYLDNSRDMSDELFNSNVAENLSLAEAIVRRILPSPTYISALYTLDEEAENMLTALHKCHKPESEKEQLALEVQKARLNWEKTSGIPEILKKHLDPSIYKIIVFCRREEEHLDEMEAEVPRWFQKAKLDKRRKTYRVLSADSASNTKNLEEFRNAKNRDTLHLLFAMDMLNEGLHIPDVGAVILLRPTESPIIFYQQIGRCMQVDANHTPIIFDFVNNFKSIKASDFLKDLVKHNDIQNIRRNSFGLTKHSLNVRIIDETQDILTVFENIKQQIQPFEVGLAHLRQFAEENGHARVPGEYKTSSGYPLGSWISTRRWDYTRGVLLDERIKALEAISGWTWDGIEAYFLEGLEHLKQYIHENGHTRVPARYKTTSGYSLGNWAVARRDEYNRGSLPKEKISLLEGIPEWHWSLYEAFFEEGLNHLKQYISEYGHAKVPRSYTPPSGYPLGAWVASKKVQYREGKLPPERIKVLETSPGWVWNRRELEFQEALDHLKQYAHEHGNTNVPLRFKTESGFPLGAWVASRRQNYNNWTMPLKAAALLETVPGWVTDQQEKFNREGLDHLRQYVEEHGHSNVPSKYKTSSGYPLGSWVADIVEKLPGWISNIEVHFDEGLDHLKQYVEENGTTKVSSRYKTSSGYPLGVWVTSIRNQYKKGWMSAERIKLLEAMPDWMWEAIGIPFQKGLKHLEQYAKKHGHTRLSSGYKDSSGLPIGNWVSSRRRDYKKGKLSIEKIKKLEAIPGWVWNLKEAEYEMGLESLKQYINEYGHTKVPLYYKDKSGFNLGVWVNARRCEYNKKSLSSSRIQTLEAFPGWIWSVPKKRLFKRGSNT